MGIIYSAAGNLTAESVIALFAAAILAAVLAITVLRALKPGKAPADPLIDLFKRENFEDQILVAAERRHRLRPPIHGQRAQMARLNEVWERDTREEAINEVARVLRMGQQSSPVPVRVLAPVAAVEEAEWEEIRLLPPPPAARHA